MPHSNRLLPLACAATLCGCADSRTTDATAAGDAGPGMADPDAGFGGFNQDGGTGCAPDPNVDNDHDGWTTMEGDCNDCDPNVNPGAVEVIGTAGTDGGMTSAPADEDCDGKIDNLAPLCDDGLALEDVDPKNGARAIDLCQTADAIPNLKRDKKWGVLEAKYVRAAGKPFGLMGTAGPKAQVGIQAGFGANVHVQQGKRMLELSTGTARNPGQPDSCASGHTCVNNDNLSNLLYGPPLGFPQPAPGCAINQTINDDVALEVRLRAPTNATGYSFDIFFFSHEYPMFVCSNFNDQFVALVDPPPKGAVHGNIAFDKASNPICINLAIFDVCDPDGMNIFGYSCRGSPGCPQPPMPYCPAGKAQIQGTIFDADMPHNGGGTGWLRTQAPVVGGKEFSIRFAIWDTGDMKYDSAILVDNFQWIANAGTVDVGTGRVPAPR